MLSPSSAGALPWVVEAPGTRLARDLGQDTSDLIGALGRAGIPCHTVRRVPFSGELQAERGALPAPGAAALVYGQVALEESVQPYRWTPGYLAGPDAATQLAHWGHWMLNPAPRLALLGDLTRPQRPVFVRPDSGAKPFDGGVVSPEGFDAWQARVLGGGQASAPAHTPVLVSPALNLEAEWRVIIAGARVVCASRYRHRGALDLERGAPQAVLDFAAERGREWSPAHAYALDIAELRQTAEGHAAPGRLRVVEANALSSAGLYALDLDRYVQGVQARFAALRGAS